MIELLQARYVYVLVVLLLAIGLYAALAERNLIKKVVGLAIFKTAVFLFFIEGSYKIQATVPIIDERFGVDAAAYVNPLPHLLILTAIVVSVAAIGVALALAIAIHRAHGTLDEEEIVRGLGD
jgi:multicomponent Na+:H+ antiporter subunit C